ncbi:Uncharacterized protein FWK35_00012167, partial [Aphis craccivora]
VNTGSILLIYKKIIMLPRVDAFKKKLTMKTFFSLVRNQTCIWNETISGRNKEDLISTFYAFFKELRDRTHIALWLDNFSSQNKNWLLLIIDIYFFEPGLTFMSADNFHHRVEEALKQLQKTYDFKDFTSAVKHANNTLLQLWALRLKKIKVALCGISESKRNDILNTLKQVLPEDRKVFWKNLPYKYIW